MRRWNPQTTPIWQRGGKRLLDIIDRAPSDKRTLANMIAEAFINGMAAQERLATQRPGA